MQLFKSTFCVLTILLHTSSHAMKDAEIIKIKGEQFSYARPLASLQELCLPALAIHVSNVIKHDPTYDSTKFKEFLTALDGYSIDTTKLLSLMAEGVTNLEWEKSFSENNESVVNQLHFSGKKIVWNYKVLRIWNSCVYARDIETNEPSITIGPNNPRSFTISSHLCFVAHDANLWIKELEKNTHAKFFETVFAISAFACDPQELRCALSDDYGGLFIVKLHNLDQQFKAYRIKKVHNNARINVLHFTPNSTLYSCDIEGNIFVWDDKNVQKLPIEKKITSIISSLDSTLIAFHHDNKENSSSILNWNTLTIAQYNLGKIIAFTQSNKILAQKERSLLTYNLDGQLLQSVELPKTACLFGNQTPSFFCPLYLMTTEKKKKRIEDIYDSEYDYGNYVPSYRGSMEKIKKGTKEIHFVKTTFWLPKHSTAEELFAKISCEKKAFKEK